MADGRYWITYTSKREHATGCDSVVFERVEDTAAAAAVLADNFMRTAHGVMENDASVTQCIVHVYDCETGRFPIHRTLERCDGLRWLHRDE